MYIFGKNGDDKGTQLEILTRSILSKLGYIKIVPNEIKTGGEEIDVSAEIHIQHINRPQVFKLICECKAYKNPVSISDWLKFLGKLFTSEKTEKYPVNACFIALNGVNGNVSGHYKNLISYINNISLVSGEDLLNHVSQIYNLCSLEQVKKVVQTFTKRQVLSFEEIAYYKENIYRIITFEGGTYTMLSSDGQPIKKDNYYSVLKEAAEFVLPAMIFIDLWEEAEAIKKKIRAQKMVLSQIFLDGGNTNNKGYNIDEFTNDEIVNAVTNLIKRGFLKQNIDLQLVFINNENFYTVLAEIYQFLLAGEMTDPVLKAIESDYHINHINEDLVSEIQKIQGGLLLSPTQVQQVILLLKWSPTALAWSLYPNEMLVNYPVQRNLVSNSIKNSTDLVCQNYFLSCLYTLFKSNFNHSDLYKHFYEVYGLREIETLEKLIVKSHKGVEFEGELVLRRAIVELDKDYIGSEENHFISIIPLDSSQEPWEYSSIADDESLTI